MQQCRQLSTASNCPRRKFGAMLIDMERDVVVADGYNGAHRGGGKLCGGTTCLRDSVISGQKIEIGCVHAEMNLICNAAANGVATRGKCLIVTGEPCKMCAKLIYQSGISVVVVLPGGYTSDNGVEFLKDNGVTVVGRTGEEEKLQKVAD
jgi:dCMP deaminase